MMAAWGVAFVFVAMLVAAIGLLACEMARSGEQQRASRESHAPVRSARHYAPPIPQPR
jgi:hypothetical protein